MPRASITLLDAVAAPVAGAFVSTANLSNPTLHTLGTFTGTIEIEGTNEDPPVAANIFQIGSDITAPGLIALDPIPNFIRANATALSAGAATLVLGAELPG